MSSVVFKGRLLDQQNRLGTYEKLGSWAQPRPADSEPGSGDMAQSCGVTPQGPAMHMQGSEPGPRRSVPLGWGFTVCILEMRKRGPRCGATCLRNSILRGRHDPAGDRRMRCWPCEQTSETPQAIQSFLLRALCPVLSIPILSIIQQIPTERSQDPFSLKERQSLEVCSLPGGLLVENPPHQACPGCTLAGRLSLPLGTRAQRSPCAS